MKFPQTFIEEIKSRVSASQVVGKFVMLKKTGREYQGLCPFHKEKTPSFTVNDEKGFYHCFGCGAHGDQIGFTMEYEHLNYVQAVEKLAGVAGLSMPVMSRQEVIREEKREGLYYVLEACCAWFEQQLHGAPEGVIARDYLESREMRSDVVRKFRLGYAPEGRYQLQEFLQTRGISVAHLVEAGVLIAVDKQEPYSRYRRRLIFPIQDVKGRVIGFGGRVLPGEPNPKAPKYINSPETSLFHKGNQLFYLHEARKHALKHARLVVAEGYMDVIAMAQAGLHSAVAPLGTALTESQLLKCWQLVPCPVLCLDGDAAGLRAMHRAVDLALPLLQPGKTLSVARLPAGEDPDSLLCQSGIEALREILRQATPLADILWQEAFFEEGATPEAKAAQEKGLFQKIGRIKDETVRQYYRQEMLQRLRERQRAGYEGKPYWGSQKGRRSVAVQPLPAMPYLPKGGDATVEEVVSKLLALAFWCPELLLDQDIEAGWMELPLTKPWQQELHAVLLEICVGDGVVLGDSFEEHVRQRMRLSYFQVVQKQVQRLGLPTNADHTSKNMLALRLWPEFMNVLQVARLREDVKEAEKALVEDISDVHFTRLSHLKQQLEALERERSSYYQGDPI